MDIDINMEGRKEREEAREERTTSGIRRRKGP
jgi:hypothetical protein